MSALTGQPLTSATRRCEDTTLLSDSTIPFFDMSGLPRVGDALSQQFSAEIFHICRLQLALLLDGCDCLLQHQPCCFHKPCRFCELFRILFLDIMAKIPLVERSITTVRMFRIHLGRVLQPVTPSLSPSSKRFPQFHPGRATSRAIVRCLVRRTKCP